jgi:hypothetical protein
MMEITQLVAFEHDSRGIVLRGLSTSPDLDHWFDSTTARIRELVTRGPGDDSAGSGHVLVGHYDAFQEGIPEVDTEMPRCHPSRRRLLVVPHERDRHRWAS